MLREIEREKVSNSLPIELIIPRGTPKDTLQVVGKTLKSNQGINKVTLVIPSNSKESIKMPLPYTVNWKKVKDKVNKLLYST